MTRSNLEDIPGIGPNIAQDLLDLGFKDKSDLRNKDPEKLYRQLCELRGKHIDRCVLYVFRCAIYFISNTVHKPELLKWWNWKDDRNY